MDLKGSLVDTNLKIYPSQQLQNFLQTLPIGDNIPANILKLVKGNDYELKKEKLNQVPKPITIHLDNKDIENLKKIKNAVNLTGSKPIKEKPERSETDLKKNDDLNDPDSKKSTESNEETTESNEETTESNEETTESNEETTDSKDNAASQRTDLYLSTLDIDWFYNHLQKKRENGDKNVPYLHVLIEGSHIEMPDNQIIKRNPDLEARCVKLRAQQEAREYRKMTKGVDNVRIRFPEDSISYQLKQINRQLIAIGQFIISIFAGFLFGFKGVEWMTGPMDFGVKLLLGVMCALVIALAEIYFLAKKLNEELSVPETVQLGGPPKFVDTAKYSQSATSNAVKKEHMD